MILFNRLAYTNLMEVNKVMELHESAEDYLEAILMIREEKGSVRSVEVAERLGVSKPSVSVAMKRLRENGYLEEEDGRGLVLTEEGMKAASRIYERHRVLSSYLMRLGVDAETARADACKMEHDLSEKSYQAIKERVTKAI